ncbi:MAG: hypothetical protein LBH87_03915, partial [Coriobacteriales bacterium]|nr:hypothetical protein [Coriobacteriales bacterium]
TGIMVLSRGVPINLPIVVGVVVWWIYGVPIVLSMGMIRMDMLLVVLGVPFIVSMLFISAKPHGLLLSARIRSFPILLVHVPTSSPATCGGR